MNGVLEHPLDREVLAELPVAEVVSAKLTLPVVVVLDRLGVDRPVDAPWCLRSACPSPSRFSVRRRIWPSTGCLKIPVVMILPPKGTAFGVTRVRARRLSSMRRISNDQIAAPPDA